VWAPISAFPSLVQTTNPPVSAIAKLTPVIDNSDSTNLFRKCCRAASVKYCGSLFPFSVCKCSWKVSLTSCFFKWMAGKTIWLGRSFLNWTIRSPRSVSTTSMPFFSRYSFKWHSSVSILLLFTIFWILFFWMIEWMIWLCSSPVAAQWIWIPLAVAFSSNSFKYWDKFDREWFFIWEPHSRKSSHSGIPCAALSRFSRTNHRVSSCQLVLGSSAINCSAKSACFAVILFYILNYSCNF